MKIIFILLLLFVFVVAVGVFFTQFARRLVPDRYEWLLVMSHYEWKSTAVLISDLLKLKKAKYSIGIKGVIYTDLGLLEDEGLIETREVVQGGAPYLITEYKLTPAGVHKRNARSAKQVDILPGNIQPS